MSDINEEIEERVQKEVNMSNLELEEKGPDRKKIMKAELEKDVRLNVFVIGVGNAGNQTIAYGHREGLNVFAINSSMRDLSDAIIDESIPSFIVGKEARGSGKNIEKGKALWKENGRELFAVKDFLDRCQDADVIFVVSATGGGTGPSVAPEICRALQRIFSKKIIIYHGIIPKNSDSNIAFANTTYCMNEIKQLGIPYSLTDLEKFANDPNDVAFEKADKHAIQCIKIFSGMYFNMSRAQMIDENDLKSIISEPGYLGAYMVDGITSADLEKKSVQSFLIDEIKNGPGVMIQKDGVSVHLGTAVNFPGDMQEATRTGNYDELFEFIGHKPKNGIYENTNITNGTTGQVTTILSGMTYPINRMNYFVDVIKEQNEFLKRQKEIDISADADLVQSMVSNSSDMLTSNTRASQDDISSALDDLF